MALVTLALGSNLGDRAENLRRGRQALAPDIALGVCSRIYESEPAYRSDQPRFLNQVCQASTELEPIETLRRLKAIESNLGRVASFRFGPRLIDLDLLFYDDRVLSSPELVVPHPLLAERPFVLVPLAEIAPNLMHPALGVSMADLLGRLGDTHDSIWPVPD